MLPGLLVGRRELGHSVASFLISGSVKLAPGVTVPGGQASGWVMD